MCNTVHKETPYPIVLLFELYINFYFFIIYIPSIAQLVERRTVVVHPTGILRSLVRLRLEGVFCKLFFFFSSTILFFKCNLEESAASVNMF